MKAKIKSVLMHGLQVAVFDESGAQIPELQTPLAVLFAERLVACGYDPAGVVIENEHGYWRLFNAGQGWNYSWIGDLFEQDATEGTENV